MFYRIGSSHSIISCLILSFLYYFILSYLLLLMVLYLFISTRHSLIPSFAFYRVLSHHTPSLYHILSYPLHLILIPSSFFLWVNLLLSYHIIFYLILSYPIFSSYLWHTILLRLFILIFVPSISPYSTSLQTPIVGGMKNNSHPRAGRQYKGRRAVTSDDDGIVQKDK